MARVAINGLGRIGRTFLKLAIQRPELDVVAVNDIADPANLAYLLRFDSIYGRYRERVDVEMGSGPSLIVGSHRLRLLQRRDPSELPWRECDVDIVVEATGTIESFERARVHLAAGARRVVLTAPAKDGEAPDARTVLVGVNTEVLNSVSLSSNGSCTTNSASPIIQVLHETIGIRKAMLNTVHGYTATQNLVDAPVRGADMRRGRAAAVSIVPASTGAAIAVTRAIPALTGRFDGVAMRVPVAVGSLSAIVFLAARPTTAAELNGGLEKAAEQARWRGVLAVTHDQLVSADIVGEPHAAIVDLSLTRVVDGDLCSVYSWYDNEVGFTHSLLEHVLEVARHVSGTAERTIGQPSPEFDPKPAALQAGAAG
jgi:glyceraldehyde 3-phosphate dehydrogenase